MSEQPEIVETMPVPVEVVEAWNKFTRLYMEWSTSKTVQVSTTKDTDKSFDTLDEFVEWELAQITDVYYTFMNKNDALYYEAFVRAVMRRVCEHFYTTYRWNLFPCGRLKTHDLKTFKWFQAFKSGDSIRSVANSVIVWINK